MRADKFVRQCLNEGENELDKLRFVLFLCVIFTLPFEMYFSSFFFSLLGILTVTGINRERLRRIPKVFWIFQAVFFLALLGYPQSAHKNEAGFLLERQLSIFLIPLLLPLAFRISEQRLRLCLYTLFASCVLSAIIMFLNVYHILVVQVGQPLRNVLEGPFFNHDFSRPLNIHAGYLSLFVALSIFFGLLRLHVAHGAGKLLLACWVLLLFAALFFLASRNAIIAFAIIVVVLYPIMVARRKVLFLVTTLLIAGACLITILNVPYLRQRFTIELLGDISPVQVGARQAMYGGEPRIQRWQGAWELIKKSPYVGYGTGDEIAMLKTEYAKRGLFISYLENFNAHNQYLSYWLKNGIIGLLLFLLAFAYYVYLALKSRDFLYLSFLILLLLAFYTENVLDANKGIFFFALFNTMLGYRALERKDQPHTAH